MEESSNSSPYFFDIHFAYGNFSITNFLSFQPIQNTVYVDAGTATAATTLTFAMVAASTATWMVKFVF